MNHFFAAMKCTKPKIDQFDCDTFEMCFLESPYTQGEFDYSMLLEKYNISQVRLEIISREIQHVGNIVAKESRLGTVNEIICNCKTKELLFSTDFYYFASRSFNFIVTESIIDNIIIINYKLPLPNKCHGAYYFDNEKYAFHPEINKLGRILSIGESSDYFM